MINFFRHMYKQDDKGLILLMKTKVIVMNIGIGMNWKDTL